MTYEVWRRRVDTGEGYVCGCSDLSVATGIADLLFTDYNWCRDNMIVSYAVKKEKEVVYRTPSRKWKTVIAEDTEGN